MLRLRIRRALPVIAGVLLAAAVHASPEDLDGSGLVDAGDEDVLRPLYGASIGTPIYDPAADLTGDGSIDLGDVARLGAAFGGSADPPDQTPPGLFVTLNDIPDDMNDLLVAPPGGFQITVHLDALGGSLIDIGSLSITASEEIAGHPPGSELVAEFAVTPSRAVWEVPPDADLARTSHYVSVSVRDLAGNLTTSTYGFAVRDFPAGPPLGDPQLVFLDFDQDRSLGPDIDFLEDLRTFGLSAGTDPAQEQAVRDFVVELILPRVKRFYGYDLDGTPGPDPVDIDFVATEPASPHAHLCVGGESSLGAPYLGAVGLDINNVNPHPDECPSTASKGVFPQAIDNLWGNDPSFRAAFDPLLPSRGGVPFGAHPLDASFWMPDFDPTEVTPEQAQRFGQLVDAFDAFVQAVATAIAHEVGHTLGLSAPGAVPKGLYGGSAGASFEHNVTPSGGTPAGNYLMNAGGSFSFDEMTGHNGVGLPVFRELSWAYLHDRIALNAKVTGLFPAPTLESVTPDPATYPGPWTGTSVTFHGSGFLAGPSVPILQLITDGDPTPNPVTSVQWIDAGTLVGNIHPISAPPALYDVRLINADGQIVVLEEGLQVQ